MFVRDAVAAAVALTGLSAFAPLDELAALGTSRGSVVHYPIPAADGVSIDKKNEVILARTKGEVFAFALSCPHQNTALRVSGKNGGFQCPRHQSRYEPNGTFIDGKATRNMDRLKIEHIGNEIVVDADVVYESDTEPAKWFAATVKL